MLHATVQFPLLRFLTGCFTQGCATTWLAVFLLVCAGCGKSEPELPKELQELRRKPDMEQAEILGFQMEVPVGWKSEIREASANFVIPGLAPGRVVIEMTFTRYAAGETADSVVKGTIDSFDRNTGSYMHQQLPKCRFPALEEVSTQSKKRNDIPNRLFYLIGTPKGKVTIVADFSQPADLATYQKELHYLACSVNLP